MNCFFPILFFKAHDSNVFFFNRKDWCTCNTRNIISTIMLQVTKHKNKSVTDFIYICNTANLIPLKKNLAQLC